jgi:ATP synthase protein I
MDERKPPDGLKSFGERLDEARRRRAPTQPRLQESDRSIMGVALGLGMRFGIELVVAVGVGFGIGWAIDRWLGTKPWAMVVFLVVGAAAGILNAWRAATGQGSAIGFRGAKKNGKSGGRSGEE